MGRKHILKQYSLFVVITVFSIMTVGALVIWFSSQGATALPTSVFDTPTFWAVVTILGFTVTAAAFYWLKRGIASVDDMATLASELGFNVAETLEPTGGLTQIFLGSINGGFLGRADTDLYVKGQFDEQWPLGFVRKTSTANTDGISLYFDCRSNVRFEHYVAKRSGEVKIQPYPSLGSKGNSSRKLREFVNTHCKDIGEFELDLVVNAPGIVLVRFGPSCLVYGAHIKQKFAATVEVTSRLRRFLRCDEKAEKSEKKSNPALIKAKIERMELDVYSRDGAWKKT